jgi:hypothetical protein
MSWYGDYAGGLLHEQRSAELRKEAERDGLARRALARRSAAAGEGDATEGGSGIRRLGDRRRRRRTTTARPALGDQGAGGASARAA